MKTNKKLFTTLLITLLFSISSSFGQTTQEEYNYITKGYKVQLESGLDMKKDIRSLIWVIQELQVVQKKGQLNLKDF